jgi:23S rRNA (cytosine1962-C5)-methyltransferase
MVRRAHHDTEIPTCNRMNPRGYSLLDFGNQRRLEQWGPYRLIRPDPTAVFDPVHPALWKNPDAVYAGEKGKGSWEVRTAIPERWVMVFHDVQLWTKLAPYKHTGVFPEQQENWSWMREAAKSRTEPLKVLNLFAYTGGATMALAKDGHFVTHVDSSRPAIGWGKENAELNALPGTAVRWILEDAAVFAAREVKRGNRYDGILLDPPAYGHGPTGTTWRVERDLAPLLEQCVELLSENPAFLLVNGYAQHDTPDSFWQLTGGILHAKRGKTGWDLDADELYLSAQDGRKLSTGIYARCVFAR